MKNSVTTVYNYQHYFSSHYSILGGARKKPYLILNAYAASVWGGWFGIASADLLECPPKLMVKNSKWNHYFGKVII